MSKFITFGSIERLNQIIRDVRHISEHPYPTIKAIASEKIHGTNASVCYSEELGFWVQSRSRIITPADDNEGCAKWAEGKKDVWIGLIKDLAEEYQVDLKKNIISVYFEWCGGRIYKSKSAVGGMPKMAMIFQYFKVSEISKEHPMDCKWLGTNCSFVYPSPMHSSSVEDGIYNIMDFPHYDIDIDFNRPDFATNILVELVKEIEPNSPVGVQLGFENNVSEGLVVQFHHKGKLYRFKAKGDKHSKSKVKKILPVDSELEQKKIDFANEVTPAWRLEQAWDSVFGLHNELKTPSRKYTGDYIRAVFADVIKEESLKLEEAGFEMKDVNKKISLICRNWFFEQLDKDLAEQVELEGK